jgi:hypothetical protein
MVMGSSWLLEGELVKRAEGTQMIRLAVIITLTPSLALAQPLPQPSQPALAARARTDTRRRDRVRCRFRTGDFVVSRGVEMGVVYFTPMRLARHGAI